MPSKLTAFLFIASFAIADIIYRTLLRDKARHTYGIGDVHVPPPPPPPREGIY